MRSGGLRNGIAKMECVTSVAQFSPLSTDRRGSLDLNIVSELRSIDEH